MNVVNPSVSIVLATRNGAAFLEDQMRSITAQSHSNWRIILSDDGSTDETLNIARDCIPRSQLQILRGPERGLALNFWNGVMRVPVGDFAAFCDQDDIWRRDKLERALSHLSPIEGPALYTAGRYITDAQMNVLSIQKRRAIAGPVSTLLRNRAAGHTCVMSPDAVTLLKRYTPGAAVPFHDWWAASVLCARGAQFVHDPTPVLYYRQHRANVFGARGGRLKSLLTGEYLRWIIANQRALRVCLPRKARLSHKAK